MALMKSRKLLLFAIAAVFAVAALSVAARQTYPTVAALSDAAERIYLRGNYAVTGETSCLASTLGFNANLTPITGTGSEVFVQSSSTQGIDTFKPNGTGTGQAREVGLLYPPGSASAFSDDASFSLTYAVASDGTLTLQEVPGSTVGTVLTGSIAGQTFTVDEPPLTGRIGRDGSVVLASADPIVETLRTSGGIVRPRICHRTRILVRVHAPGDADED
jgi:hypothetical protein